MGKKGKAKISKVKRNNQTTNKMRKAGTLKLQRHRPRVQKQHEQQKVQQPEYSSESEAGDEWADMLDDEEQKYILERIAKQPQLLSNVPENDPAESNSRRGTKRKKKERMPKPQKSLGSDSGAETDSDSNSDVEEQYEKELADRPVKKMRPLLPIKTKEGILEQAEECEESESEVDVASKLQKPDQAAEDSESDTDSGVEGTAEGEGPDVITTVDLMAARRDKLNNDKLRIGALCSSLLECPEKKLKNLFPILYLMEERLKDGTANLVSVRRLATLSAAEVFRDILPDYCIRHQDYSNVKLKKDTLALYKYEKELLEFYKRYLQRLEKAFSVLRQRRGDNRTVDEATTSLAVVSLQCMCSLLVARPQFNYSANIAQSVVPLLAGPAPARAAVARCLADVFADDRKGEITLTIVRLINQLVKRRGERLHPATLDCLLTLNITDVDLDEAADLQHKKKQDEKKKKRIVNLSKKEKKRAKKLKEVERELLETQAAESAAARRRHLAEVVRTVFHLYFRLLKTAPTSPLMTAALQGIAKFTHVINLEYYSDLVAVLSRTLRAAAGAGRVLSRTRLRCARAALGVLAGAGDALNVDPAVFHAQLYCDALTVHAGSTSTDAALVLGAVCDVVARARRVSGAVLCALGKRAATLAAQLPHGGALGALAALHALMQHKPVSSLLDTEERSGSGRFDALLPSPEHCNAHAAALHELCALRRHYHPTVRAAAAALLRGEWLAELAKLSPLKILEEYDGSQMSFKPAVPPPRPAPLAKNKPHTWTTDDFRLYCETIANTVDMKLTEAVVR